MIVELRRIALARSGDKGGHANIGVWTNSDKLYEVLVREVSAERVAGHFAAFGPRSVERYELPRLRALNFVLRGVLGVEGAAASLRTDAQAKTYSQGLLTLAVEVPEGLVDR